MSHKPVVFSSLLLLNVPQFVQIYPLNVFLVWICGRWIVQDNHKLMLNGIYLQLSFSCDWTWLPSYLIWNYWIWRLWFGKWLLYWFMISIPSLLFLLWDPRKKGVSAFANVYQLLLSPITSVELCCGFTGFWCRKLRHILSKSAESGAVDSARISRGVHLRTRSFCSEIVFFHNI